MVFPRMDPGDQPEMSDLVASVFYTLRYLAHDNNFKQYLTSSCLLWGELCCDLPTYRVIV